jgi:hypothetical protein
MSTPAEKFPATFPSFNAYEFKFRTATAPDWALRAPIPVTVYEHAVVAPTNDTVLLCGGWQNHAIANRCYLYTPSTDKWDDAWPMNYNRTGHGLSLYKGSVYAYGGYNGTFLSSIEVLSLTHGWSVMPYLMNTSTAFFASVVLPEPAEPSLQWLLDTAICIAALVVVAVMCVLLLRWLRRLNTRIVFIDVTQLAIVYQL